MTIRLKSAAEVRKWLHNNQKKVKKNSKNNRSPGRIPPESSEARALIIWTEMMKVQIPELAMIYAIPNGQDRDPRIGAILQLEGVKPGIPDYCLPVPRFPYHGLYLELKRLDGGAGLSLEQKHWKGLLKSQGYFFCKPDGWYEASLCLKRYLELPRWDTVLGKEFFHVYKGISQKNKMDA